MLGEKLYSPALEFHWVWRGFEYRFGFEKRLKSHIDEMFLVSGIPRASTTLVAKFLSLDDALFCYAGETHVLSFLHKYFEYQPCNPDRVVHISDILRRHLEQTLIETPRYSVNQGAHSGNLLFNQRHVTMLVDNLVEALRCGCYGADLFRVALQALADVLSQVSSRQYLGEKTPDTLFAIAAYGDIVPVKNFVVVREPIGVLRSMTARVEGGDPYSNVFNGGVESNIGIYLDHADAVRATVRQRDSHLVRFEDLATDPRGVLVKLFSQFDLEPEDRVLDFVENGKDQGIADRAPMYYHRLKIKADTASLSPTDVWKIIHFTKDARELFGYNENFLKDMGFDFPNEWPGPDVRNAMLVPISGFHDPDIAISRLWNSKLIKRWIKNRAKLVVYLPKRKSCKLELNFLSHFPDAILSGDKAEIIASVAGSVRDTAHVSQGSQRANICVDLREEDIRPMGVRGGYVFIQLQPSTFFCPIAHTPDSWDLRILSFQLVDWGVSWL